MDGSDRFERSRRRLSYVGSACAAGYVLAASVQAIILLFFVKEDASPAQAILIRCQGADLLRAVVVLASMFLSLVTFVAIALNRLRKASGAALLGLVSAVLVVVMEVGYRSIDLFVVSLQWARAYCAASEEVLEEQLLERTIQWDGIVTALYFPLLVALVLASGCFALALSGEQRRTARLAALGWVLYGATQFLRILGGYAGLVWLEPFNNRIYFPAASAAYGFTAVWLWGEARSARGAAQ